MRAAARVIRSQPASLPRRGVALPPAPLTAYYIDHLHEYFASDTGERLPHVTGMLERSGWTDSTWMNDEGRIRGTEVHDLAKEYDLGAIVDPHQVTTRYPGYLAGYVAAVTFLEAVWDEIEVINMHQQLRYACRLDRLGTVYAPARLAGKRVIAEIKTGAEEKSVAIQTALQALAAGSRGGLPAEFYTRLVIYVRADGKFSVVELLDHKHDFREAYKVIRECCS